MRRFPKAKRNEYSVLLAQSRTPLWTTESVVEDSLQLGKVQNLRKACGKLHLVEVPTGQTFSFWKQIGRVRASDGYAIGRELRQGCLIPTIGGGLCQLSNSLYDAALKSSCQIVERHAHTAAVPGSAAEYGRDATIFWNYVDLRFTAPQDLLVTARLTSDELVLEFLGKHPLSFISVGRPATELRPALEINTCNDCGTESCFRHVKNSGVRPRGHTSFLIEECWPEFDEFCRQARSEKDELFLPWLSSWSRQPHRYHWDSERYSRVVAANLPTLLSFTQAKFGFAGRLPPIARQVRRSQALADYYAERLSSSASFLFIGQTLLPFLWQAGDLGGRRFSVLTTRLPLNLLHSKLDDLAWRFPEQKTFREFRAPDWMVEAEAEALSQAETIVTPHAWLALLFPDKTQKLSWKFPRVARCEAGSYIVFPGPTVARKGAYQLRDAMKGLKEKLVLLGNNLESNTFWDGVNASTPKQGQDWAQQASVVVQPAFIENAPRPLLRALAAGLPVIATPECGLDAHPNLVLVGAGDTGSLRGALHDIVRAGKS